MLLNTIARNIVLASIPFMLIGFFAVFTAIVLYVAGKLKQKIAK